MCVKYYKGGLSQATSQELLGWKSSIFQAEEDIRIIQTMKQTFDSAQEYTFICIH